MACVQSKDVYPMSNEEKAQLQAHLRRMYIDLEKVCNRHGLQMMVAYGSVLGALRHDGFIPWDDDMDLLMPREDYDKLVNEYATELPPQYKIYGPNTGNGARNRFGQIVDTSTRLISVGFKDEPQFGIYLDVFVLENCPTNRWLRIFRMLKQNFYLLATTCTFDLVYDTDVRRKVMTSLPELKKAYRRRKLIGRLFSFRSANAWADSFDKAAQYYKNTGYYCVPSGGTLERYHEPIPIGEYIPVIRHKFDDIEVNIPSQAVRHLEREYGEWTSIPPVDKREQHFVESIKFKV